MKSIVMVIVVLGALGSATWALIGNDEPVVADHPGWFAVQSVGGYCPPHTTLSLRGGSVWGASGVKVTTPGVTVARYSPTVGS